MAVDPAKLGALVAEQNANPFGDGTPPKNDQGGGEEKSADKSPRERGDELLDSMGEVGMDLRENADILLEIASEIGEDLIAEMPAQDTVDAAADALERMPDFLSAGIRSGIVSKEEPDLFAIATALTQSDEEAKLLSGFFAALEGLAEEEGADDEDEDEDEETDEDEGAFPDEDEEAAE